MKFSTYRDLDWQSQDEAFYTWCEEQDVDHTDPDAFRWFICELEAA